MLAESALLAISFGGVLYTLGAILVSVLALLLIIVVLMQDSKEGGLGGAFGSGMGSEMLGARGQKDIARVTGVLAAVLAVLVIVLGASDSASTKAASVREGDEGTMRALPEDAVEEAGANDNAASAGTPPAGEGFIPPPAGGAAPPAGGAAPPAGGAAPPAGGAAPPAGGAAPPAGAAGPQ